jgi:hypothetical protein
MKKPSQIAADRTIQRVRQWAEERNPALQLVLPMIGILALAKQGACALVQETGLGVFLLAIRQDADALTRTLHQHRAFPPSSKAPLIA